MTVLDTNVLSGLMQSLPDPVVRDWLDRQRMESVWTTSVTVFEIRTGIQRMPAGRKRRQIEDAFDLIVTEDLEGRVLPFDRAAAEEAGQWAAARRRAGFADDARDLQIAGIVLARRAILATRNVRHFHRLGARVVNPWAEG